MLLNNLSLDSLRTLVITQDLGGFGRAAERLLRTPSAISLQMKRLQEEVGVPLFRKQGRKTLLTEQGEIALQYARRVLELNDEMIDTLRGSSLAGVVRIGFAQDFTSNVLPLVIERFNALYPLVKLEVTVDVGQVLLQAIDSGDLDVALTLGGAQKKTAHLLASCRCTGSQAHLSGIAYGSRYRLLFSTPRADVRRRGWRHWKELDALGALR